MRDVYFRSRILTRHPAISPKLEVAPYLWVKTPDGLTSWQMFDRMLNELNIVITPGRGFGAQGDTFKKKLVIRLRV